MTETSTSDGTPHAGFVPGRAASCLLALALAGAPLAMDSSAQSLRGDTGARYTEDGTDHCLRCHGSERMRIVAETAHGNTENPFTPYSNQGCEACHGPGSLHVSRARGGIGFPEMLAFRRDEPPQRHNSACLGCHASDMGDLEGMAWQGSVHDTGGISCIRCHEGHSIGNPLTQREAQVAVCSTCHSVQITNHRRFENVGIVFDDLKCYNCHDVHQMIRER